VATALAVFAVAALLPATALAGKHHHKPKGPSGVKGVVLDATCYGPCAVPAPPQPVYTGAVTIQVRGLDGATVASQPASAGHFRIQLRPGSYDVASVPPTPTPPPPCQPQPETVCPLVAGPEPAVIIAPCETGETQRVEVRHHRFAPVQLHVQNTCIV
jgi:hypothetical protein